MGCGHSEYRLPRDLAGFEPVTICFQQPKMPRELGGVRFFTVLDSGLPQPLLKQEKLQRVTASFRDHVTQ